MARVIYGVWNGVVYDNRDKMTVDIQENEALKGIDVFNEGNAIQAFIGDKGFLVFDPCVNLLDAFWRYMERAKAESCGKCTPCRMGTKIIADRLEAMRLGSNDEKSWDEVERLAHQIKDTALCGLGQTCATALCFALEYFRDKLAQDANAPMVEQNHMAYVTAPCIEACPSKIDVPRYISYIKDGRTEYSLGVILQKYPMAATCGRVCVRFCEMACRRKFVDEAVGIKTLKRFVADQQSGQRKTMFAECAISEPKSESMKVAIIGAGPAGVACAYHLLLNGYHVDVFESEKEAGGMAARGIPSYRLPKDVLKSETDIIETLGGSFKFGKSLGKDYSVDSLLKGGYKAAFIAIGCDQSTPLGAEGEDQPVDGLMSGIDFLVHVFHHVEGEKPLMLNGDIVVVGGGNVAMDCVRSAIRLGARVHMVYRRTEADLPADREEIEAAKEEGVICHFLSNPTKILSKDGMLTGIEIVSMRQTAPDVSGRCGVEPIPGSEQVFNCELVISAVGQQIDRSLLKPEDAVKVNKRGLIEVNEATLETSRQGVFSGGDCVTGPATLIHAMAAGLRAARGIDDYLRYGKVRFSPVTRMCQILNDNKILASDCLQSPVKSMLRVHHPELDPEIRKQIFEEVEKVIPQEDAYREAKRCMRCYRVYSVITESPIPEVYHKAFSV